jgi:hypothetical protein
MGYYHSTYFAYGVHVPNVDSAWQEADRADDALPKIKATCPDVGHLCAGNYDRDRFFLVTKSEEVSLGKYAHVTPQTATPEQIADWDRQLAAAVKALGYTDTSAPGWIVVPDLS